jgi:hypothetical protein
MGRKSLFALNFDPPRLRFQPVGVFKEVSYKFGRCWGVVWMQRPVRQPGWTRPAG